MELIKQSIQASQAVKAKGKAKDEFDHMINWKRVFEQIWLQIRWMQSYGQINELALRKIMKKFMKNFFAIKDNTIKNRLSFLLDGKAFKVKEGGQTNRDLMILSDNLLTFYADVFCKGSRQKARRSLDAQHNEIRKKDSNMIAFFGGISVSLLIFCLFFLCLDPQDGAPHWEELYSGLDIFIFFFVMCFLMLSTGIAVQVFREYSINYAFIFEID